MTYKFVNNDIRYTAWCRENPSGYVFNFFGGTEAQGSMNKIHRADCHHLWRERDEGRRTTTYPKICSMNLTDLVNFVIDQRGFSWTFCETCKPKSP